METNKKHNRKQNLKFNKLKNIDSVIREIQNRHFLLIILEVNNQNADGISDTIILLRSMTNTPIVVVSDEFIDVSIKVNMLNNGADNVYSLPMTLEEALASIFSQLRRYTELNKPMKQSMIIYSCGILINLGYRRVYVNGQEIVLLRKEYEILSLLMKNQRKVLTHEYIIRKIWGEEDYIVNSKDILWNQIIRLRKKLQVSQGLPNYIRTEHGIGYSFDPQYSPVDAEPDTF